MVSGIEAVGLVAGFLIAVGLVPQISRVWRLKDAGQISLTFNLVTIGGTVLWIGYGFNLGLVSVMIWNSVNLALLLSLLAVKLKYGMNGGEKTRERGVVV